MNWIDKDLVLQGRKVILKPLQPEDIEPLLAISKDPKIWEFVGVDHKDPDFARKFFEEGLKYRERGKHYPFIIYDDENNIIGTTRFGEVMSEHLSLEIGWTWYIPEVWGKGYNEECKYLLLKYSFEVLKTVRVQLRTNEKNYRSRRAIQRIGCQFEGILRNHVIRTGVVRNTAYFSMLPEEWETVQHNLLDIIERKYAGTYTWA
jgi:RimJ/RimL family protein N-acetyltransferase